MSNLVLYKEEKSKNLETFTIDQLIVRLSKTRSISRSQLYRWLKHLKILPTWKDGYTEEDYLKIFKFAKLMNKHKSIKSALKQLAVYYPELSHEIKSQRIQNNENQQSTQQCQNSTGSFFRIIYPDRNR